MWAYTIRRLLLMLPTLFGGALFVFALMNVVPGDIALLIIGGDQGGEIDPHELHALREQLGLTRPLYVQFFSWLWRAIQFDFGTSLWTGEAIVHELLIRLPLTLEVAFISTIISTIIAIPLGTLAAMRQDTWIDYAVRVFSIGGLAIPSFWSALLIILFLVLFSEWGHLSNLSGLPMIPWKISKRWCGPL